MWAKYARPLVSSPFRVRVPLCRYSTIPFDTQAFALGRFEPCCPDTSVDRAANGFVPCQKHPLPAVLGKKIDMDADMVAQRTSPQRHIVMCVGADAPDWTRSKVEAVPGGAVHVAQALEHEYLKSHRHDPPPPTDNSFLMTIADRAPAKSNTLCDVLVFPDFVAYTGVDAETMRDPAQLQPVLASLWRDPAQPLPKTPLQQPLPDDVFAVILVCTHERRDMRCGKIGPLIVDALRRGVDARRADLPGKVLVYGTSHFGGHKFAGNMIIHQRGLGGQMYGNVRECHVDGIIDRHIIHRKVIRELWRGQVTPPLDELPVRS
ncbi:Sucrase/ferredoxin-like-domain-containing protein [Gongronella butleri]|nr:Sucrase/ferredoxin-like-domain-containing protein [Gongronella butleri]